MKRPTIQNITLSAMFLAIGMLLPFLTGQIQQIGNKLLPMHLPVMLCGLICGWPYGLAVGFLLPLLRSVCFGMPVLFPNAASMAFELAAYGLTAGFLYGRSRWKCIVSLYRSLLVSMVAGRIVWGIAQLLFLGIDGSTFTWQMFLTGALISAVPGIILQLVLIPAIMVTLKRAGMVSLHDGHIHRKTLHHKDRNVCEKE